MNPVFLFDLDGTLVDTMPWHLKTWEAVVAQLGGTLKGDALLKELYGKGVELMQRILPGRTFSSEEADAIIMQKEAMFRACYAKQLKLLPGVRDFLEAAAIRKIKMGIGTSGNHTNVDMILHQLNIHSFFSAIISADDVQHGKPHPETWWKLARVLNALPEQCIVFEDAPKGVEAAKYAGMKAIAITGHFTAADFAVYDNVLHIISDFHALTVEDLC